MKKTFHAADYDLAATLDSGQAFRWKFTDAGWEGTIGDRWVRLLQRGDKIVAEVVGKPESWDWLKNYLRMEDDLAEIIKTFPDDEPMRASTGACRGLRLLQQPAWECLASFICSSSKQIVQIRQIVAHLCHRFGDELETDSATDWFGFPRPEILAKSNEVELRDCKMGYRAPYVLGSAQMVASGEIDLESIAKMDCGDARQSLLKLPGVGRKVADCVLLFAYGFQEAFPIDVWIGRGLRELYFPRRKPTRQRLEKFTGTYFGPYAGYAQQYLFHYVRTKRTADKS
ncbi:MAG: DNA-3-methyladenine glycosylase family protein [Limisphaerales bacterium]